MKRKINLVIAAAFIITTAFSQQKNKNVPIVINKLTIYENKSQLIIHWSTEGDSASNVWQVQRSADAKQFTTIAIVLGNDPTQPGNAYAYKEKLKRRKATKYYYRLCHIDTKGEQQFSEILTPAK
ncbi:hypothetical protein [Ferruginibacter sp.]